MYKLLANFEFAYIDPGSGSFLIQLLVGGLLAVAFTIKTWQIKILQAARRFFKPDSIEDQGSDHEPKN